MSEKEKPTSIRLTARTKKQIEELTQFFEWGERSRVRVIEHAIDELYRIILRENNEF
jgi:hypothetical protein